MCNSLRGVGEGSAPKGRAERRGWAFTDSLLCSWPQARPLSRAISSRKYSALAKSTGLRVHRAGVEVQLPWLLAGRHPTSGFTRPSLDVFICKVNNPSLHLQELPRGLNETVDGKLLAACWTRQHELRGC